MRRGIIGLVAAAAALAIAACSGLATDADIGNGLAKMDAKRSAALSAAESAPTEEAKAKALQEAEAIAAKRAELADIEAKIAAAAKEAEAQASAVSTIGALVPGVGGAIGFGALVAGFSLLGQLKWRRVARQIIDGFEAAQAASPDLASAIDEAAPLIHSAMDVSTIATVRGELSRRRSRSGPPARNRPATPTATAKRRTAKAVAAA